MSWGGAERGRAPRGVDGNLYAAYDPQHRDGRDAEQWRGDHGPPRRQPWSRDAPPRREGGGRAPRPSGSSNPYTQARLAERYRRPIPNIWSRSPSPPPTPRSQPSSPSSMSSVASPAPPVPPATALPAPADGRHDSPSTAAAPAPPVFVAVKPVAEAPAAPPDTRHTGPTGDTDSDASDSDASSGVFGPQIPPALQGGDAGPASTAAPPLRTKPGGYGGALRPGEGEAIAQYVQSGQRIPRRGEVGWDSEKIEKLEGLGYVMSGNRNKRMNAVRLRKENQVYSAEEKRELARFNFEAQQAREARLMDRARDTLRKKGFLDAGEGGDASAPEGATARKPGSHAAPWNMAK